MLVADRAKCRDPLRDRISGIYCPDQLIAWGGAARFCSVEQHAGLQPTKVLPGKKHRRRFVRRRARVLQRGAGGGWRSYVLHTAEVRVRETLAQLARAEAT